MPVNARGIVLLAVLTLTGPSTSTAQTLSPFSEFQGLSSSELATVQGKLTYVGSGSVRPYTLIFAANGHTPDVGVFRPFYRPQFIYDRDEASPRSFNASTAELQAIIEGVGSIGSVTDGDVDANGGIAFALSVVKNSTVKVFESVMDTMSTRMVLAQIAQALASNQSALGEINGLGCLIGILPSAPPQEVTAGTSIRLRGFRKDRKTSHYIGTVRITNTGGQPLSGPLTFVFTTNGNITAVAPTGHTCGIAPTHAVYIDLPIGNALGSGQHVDATLRFENPDDDPIRLVVQRVYAGPGLR